MQGVIKSFDPVTVTGIVVTDTDLTEYELATDALDGSLFRMLRPGQRVVFELTADELATSLRTGSEADMGTPKFLDDHFVIEPVADLHPATEKADNAAG